MTCQTASAKWAVGPALAGWRGTLLGLGLSEGLGLSGTGTKKRMIDHKDATKAWPTRDGLAPGAAVLSPPPLTKLSEAEAFPMAAGSTN